MMKTVWLTQKQMSELFEKDRKTVTRHIKNIYIDTELNEKEVCSFFEHTAQDGKKYKVQYYNLDMIIAIGYRVKSKRGIKFRKWATKILKEYMLKGYVMNQKILEKDIIKVINEVLKYSDEKFEIIDKRIEDLDNEIKEIKILIGKK